jgi:DNA-binding beta-propeller fold protein YncE
MVSDVNAGAVTVLRNGAIADVIRVGNRPHGLAVDPRTGDVYVASTVPGAPAVTKAVRKRPPEP